MTNLVLNRVDFLGAFIIDVTDNIIVKDLTNKVLYYEDIYNISSRYVDINDYLLKKFNFFLLKMINRLNFKKLF